jgi:hypothetical protein
MGSEFDLNTIDFGDGFTWAHVQKRLRQEDGFRLPNAAEAVMIDFPYQAIWVSDIIGESNAVMDREYGIQVIAHSANPALGLILVEV